MNEQPIKPADRKQHHIPTARPDGRKALFLDIQRHLTQDTAPSAWLNQIRKDRRFGEYPFDMLKRLQDTQQSPVHHPEGTVWNHTMMVVDEAAKRRSSSRDETAFLWAALLHDIGKAPTTRKRNGKLTSYDHDKVGAEMARKFLREFTGDEAFIEKVGSLILYHMQVLYLEKNLPQWDPDGIRVNTDVAELALLSLCDRLGRGGSDPDKEEKNITSFLSIASNKTMRLH